jgi:hypothetical protein
MFATFQKNVQASEQFWGPVCSGINVPVETDPRHQLRNYFFSHGHHLTSAAEKVSSEQAYRVALNLWNHWRAGTHVQVVRNLAERPEVKS